MENRLVYMILSTILAFLSFVVVGIWSDSVIAKVVSAIFVVLGAYFFRKY